MEEKKIEKVKKSLLREKKRLENELARLEAENRSTNENEVAGEVNFEDHLPDSASTTFERERDFSLEQNVREVLDQVKRAIEKINLNQYGICSRCGKLISEERLKALPYAELCIDCKKKSER